ncbi:tandem-95 repeat protein [Mycolicibacterium pulveris]|uniref:Ig-like domain-containing protein n=1 Tax=Mycolicibacterium pulveris TaxID=36813 RepID=UPI0013D4F35D|nr:Ig-like domain-containing protein [Mycolicibacterium pulveris]MCV6979995.1 tandem-95 repeat protein [Mycolicibacterium pulveris]
MGRVGALAVALGVGVAVATGGSGLALADTGSAGDSPSSGTSSSDGTQTESASVDDEADGDDDGDGVDPDVDDVADAELSADAAVAIDDEEYEDYDDADNVDEPETDVDDQEDAVETVEPESLVTQRDSGLQVDLDGGSERIGDTVSVAEPADDRYADELTEEVQQPAESLTSRVRVDTLLDEPASQLSTVLADDEPTPTPTPTTTSSDVFGIAGTWVAALLAPFVAPGPKAPAEPPLIWALLGWVRREFQRTFLNHTPTPVVDDITTSEDTPITVDVVSGTDPDAVVGDVVTLTKVTPPQNGTVTYDGGVLTYTPNADFHGTDTLTYTISDEASPFHVHGLLRGLWAALLGGDAGHASTATVTVTVAPVNDAPEAVDDFVTVVEDSGVTAIDVLGNDTDVDGDALSVIGVGAAANGIASLTDGVVTYAPDADFHGTDTFSYTISDGMGATATATVTVTVTPEQDPPVAGDDTYTTQEDTPITIPAPGVLGNDFDADGDFMLVELADPPGEGIVSLEADGSFTYSPNADFHGIDSFTYTVSDGNGGTGSATVYVTVDSVNDAPVAVDDFVAVDEDSGATVIDVLGNDSDVDGDALSVTAVGTASGGTVTLVDGVITYTPDADFHGTDSFTYTVSDGNGGTASATVHVTVNSVNEAPVANDDDVSTNENTPIVIDVLGNDYDVDTEDELAVSLLWPPAHGIAVVNENGTVTYTPDTGYRGIDTFTYQLDDGTDTSSIARVTITVHRAPLVANDDDMVTDEDASVVIDILANDSDPSGETITHVFINSPTNGTVHVLGTVRPTLRYVPGPDFFGVDSFTYTVMDVYGRDATATVTITVNPVNDAPEAVDDNVTVRTNSGPTVVDVLGNDSDVDGDDLSVTDVGTATNGTVSLSDGVITYTPDPDFAGADSFTYTITDGNDGVATATVRVWVHNPPVANDDFASTEEGMPVVIDVLGNDFDPSGGEHLSVRLFQQPSMGTAELNDDGTITYTPTAGFLGLTRIGYEIEDGTGARSQAFVNVEVRERTLVARDVAVDIDENSPQNIHIIFHDNLPGEGTDISIRVDNPGNGVVRFVERNGEVFRLAYTPQPQFVGTDSFTYQLVGADGRVSHPYTVTVTVNPVTGGPRALDDTVVVDQDSDAVEIDVLANDFDVDRQELTVVHVSGARNGTVTVNDGVITYRPNTGFDGVDSFTYTVANSFGVAATATVAVTVKDAEPITFDDEVVPSQTFLDMHANLIHVLTDDELRIVHRGTGRWDIIELGATPSSVTVTSRGDYAYVGTSDGADVTAVAKIDLRTGASTAIGEVAQPTAMALNRSERKLYVANYQDATVSVIDTQTGEQQILDIGLRSNSIAVSEFGETLYVGSINNEVWAVNGETGSKELVYSGAWDETTVADLSVTAVRNFVYVADGLNKRVAVIDTSTNETYAVYDVWDSPTGVIASRYGGVVLVASRAENKIAVISLELGVLGAFEVGGDLIDIDFADTFQDDAYVTTREGISRIRTADIYYLFRTDQL